MEPYTSATSRRRLLADDVLQTAALLRDRAVEIQRAAAEAQRRAVLARQEAERARVDAIRALENQRHRADRMAARLTARRAGRCGEDVAGAVLGVV
jgi:hypothetical protein